MIMVIMTVLPPSPATDVRLLVPRTGESVALPGKRALQMCSVKDHEASTSTWVMRVALCDHEHPCKRQAEGPSPRRRDRREPRGVGLWTERRRRGPAPPWGLPKDGGPADVFTLTSDLQNPKRIRGRRVSR